jgi:hypothetical protein
MRFWDNSIGKWDWLSQKKKTFSEQAIESGELEKVFVVT